MLIGWLCRASIFCALKENVLFVRVIGVYDSGVFDSEFEIDVFAPALSSVRIMALLSFAIATGVRQNTKRSDLV
ncbi:MAG: hypothetical protein WCT20_01895 [Candidatus Babeliales bacterium]|jgi:hypothetical protein